MSRAFTSGSSQYLVGAGASVGTYPFSIAAWYRPSATEQDAGIISLGNGTDRHALYQNQQSIGMYSETGASGTQARAINAAVFGGSWAHVGGVVASGTSRKTYVNGVLDATDTTNVATGALTSTFIGAAHQQTSLSPTLYCNGTLAEVGVWDAELTAEEWASLAAGCSPMLIRPTSLRGYWPLMGRGTAEEDWVGALPLATPNAATVADQVRIIMPAQQMTLFSSAAGGGSPDVTTAITGAGITSAAGTIGTARSIALSGQTATSSTGTLGPATIRALAGEAATVATGQMTPVISHTITGQAATVAQGNIGASVTVALTGLSINTALGTMTSAGAAPDPLFVPGSVGVIGRMSAADISALTTATLSRIAVRAKISATHGVSTTMRATPISALTTISAADINRTVEMI